MRIPENPTRVTGLLLKWGRGDEGALEQLIPLVHRELHQIAQRCMARERPGHSLQATVLVECRENLGGSPYLDYVVPS